MSLKPSDELTKLYAGLDRDKEVVVYCQSGVRAQVTAAVLRDLGFKDVQVYEPSWLGYAGVLSEPAEDEVFLNVGALNGRIAALQGRVAELDAELTKVKEAARRRSSECDGAVRMFVRRAAPRADSIRRCGLRHA